jgi:hypothetical protein
MTGYLNQQFARTRKGPNVHGSGHTPDSEVEPRDPAPANVERALTDVSERLPEVPQKREPEWGPPVALAHRSTQVAFCPSRAVTTYWCLRLGG